MKPVTALTGENEIFKRDYLDKILSKIPKDNITVFFADDADSSLVFSHCTDGSLFGDSVTAVVKNIDSLSDKSRKDFDKSLAAYLEHLNPDNFLILLAEKFGSALSSKIKEKGEIVEFKRAYRNEITRYISSKLTENKISFDPQVPDFITTLANEDISEAVPMLNIALNSARLSMRLTMDDADDLLVRSTNGNIFDFIGGIFKKDPIKALNALSDLRLAGEPAIRVGYMLLRTAKLMWRYLSLEDRTAAAESLKIKPYEIRMLGEYSRHTDMKFTSAVIDLVKRVEMKAKSMPESFAFLEIEGFILTKASCG